MEYYERERIIAECRKKLPYPISFYDRLSDGSLWNVYQKHVVNNIPINKREQKAKAENDKARAQEKTKIEQQEEYYQITLEDYMAMMEPIKPKVVKSSQGNWWRLNDSGNYDWIPDSELDDVLRTFGVVEETYEEPKQLSLGLRRRNGSI